MTNRDVEQRLGAYRVPFPPRDLRARVLGSVPTTPCSRRENGTEGRKPGWGLEIGLAAAASLLIVASLTVGYGGRGGTSSTRFQPMPAELRAAGFPARVIREEPRKMPPHRFADFEGVETPERSER